MGAPTHFIAVTGFVKNQTGMVLMIRSPLRGWELPGGQVEQGEDLQTALQREVMEETGINVDVGRLMGIYTKIHSPDLVILCFECQPVSGNVVTSEESIEVEWIPRNAILDRITHPAIRGRVEDLLGSDGRVVYKVYSSNPYKIHLQRYL